MKTTENYLEEIKDIRKMMQESSRFLTLSGLSGILVGIYALVGAFACYRIIYQPSTEIVHSINLVPQLFTLAAIVLILSLLTIIILTNRRAKKAGKKLLNPGSRLMLINLAIPIITGGVFVLIFVFKGVYDIILPATLIFYGLALVNAAKFTRHEIFYLGIFQISLGLLAAFLSVFGLIFWALGFGVLHIIYGILMYFRYEHKPNE